MSLRREMSAATQRPVAELEFGVADLPEVRHLAATAAEDAGMPDEKVDDLSFALNEIATNAIMHGSPPNTLRIWAQADEVVTEVSDRGAGIEDASPGESRPPAEATRGRGIWLARRLCDAVEIRNGARCTVTLRMSGAKSAATPREAALAH